MMLSAPFRAHQDSALAQDLISRYGKTSPELEEGWHLLLPLGYKMKDRFFIRPEHMVILKPGFDPFHSYFSGNPKAEPRAILPVWDLFMSQGKKFAGNRKFESDLAGLTAEVLSQYANAFQKKIAHAFSEKEDSAFKKRTAHFIVLLSDLDRLLDAEPELARGTWVNRDQSNFNDQSNFARRHLIRSVYLPRWKILFKYAASCLTTHQKYEYTVIQSRIENLKPEQSPFQANEKPFEFTEDSLIHEIYQKYKDADLGSD